MLSAPMWWTPLKATEVGLFALLFTSLSFGVTQSFAGHETDSLSIAVHGCVALATDDFVRWKSERTENHADDLEITAQTLQGY
jgi:hypothetical protein